MRWLPVLLALSSGCPFPGRCEPVEGDVDNVSVPAADYAAALDPDGTLSDEGCAALCEDYILASEVTEVTACEVRAEPEGDTGGAAALRCTWDGVPACG